MATIKKLKPVLVEWQDIIDGGGEWSDDHELEPVTVWTAGFILSKGPKHIVIVRDYYDHEEKRTFGGRLSIPVGTVVRIQNLG
jgi:hypothetical protein